MRPFPFLRATISLLRLIWQKLKIVHGWFSWLNRWLFLIAGGVMLAVGAVKLVHDLDFASRVAVVPAVLISVDAKVEEPSFDDRKSQTPQIVYTSHYEYKVGRQKYAGSDEGMLEHGHIYYDQAHPERSSITEPSGVVGGALMGFGLFALFAGWIISLWVRKDQPHGSGARRT